MKRTLIIVLVIFFTNSIFPQTRLLIKKTNGITDSLLLSDIKSITFNTNPVFSETFGDGDFTNNPSWIANVSSSGCPLGTISVINGELKAYQTNGNGCGNGAFIMINVNIPVSNSTQIQFDVKPTYSNVAGGAGVQNDEYPAVINLWIVTSTSETVVVRFAYNYRGGASWTGSNYIVKAFPNCQQNVWRRNEQFVLKEHVPNAVKIIKIQAGGQGWNYEGYFDNIKIIN